MPLSTPQFDDIRQALVRDLQNQAPDIDVHADSDFFIRATAVASAVEGLYHHQAWMARQIFPDTADSDYLELHARTRQLERKPAVPARGVVNVSGVPGAAVPAGLVVKCDTRTYITIQNIILDEKGQGAVSAVAQIAGSAGNSKDSAAELVSAPPGVASQAILTMQGGIDQENDSALLARLLDLIRRPPAGGNKYDYYRWAMEVPGVSAAYIYPLRRGLGTVDVVITSGKGLPSADTIAAVKEHIDTLRPVTAKACFVTGPQEKTIDVAIELSWNGVTLADMQKKINVALTAYFDQLAPGQPAIKSRIEAIVSDLDGVTDRAISQPASNINAIVDSTRVEWLRLGRITVTAMKGMSA